MQSRLPDINTAFIIYRREAISSWKSQNYDSAFGSLQTLNGLLPKEYQVRISDKEYAEQVNKDILFVCGNCENKAEQSKLTIKDRFLSLMTNLVSGDAMEKVWVCPKCNNENKVEKTNMLKQVLEEPYYLGVIPKPPSKKEGMMDRTRYYIVFSKWFWQCISELECRMAKFRDDNWQKQDSIFDFDEALEDAGEGDD